MLIYLVPHGDASLAQVVRVEYFFGNNWENKVFESYDRSRGYPILISADGSFLCIARLAFNDGKAVFLFRYIDFEVGANAPMPASENPQFRIESE